MSALPASVQALLWDCDLLSISWERYASFLSERVLSRGDWDSICWLRETAGDQRLRELIRQTHGRFLPRQQIRFWQLLLALPGPEVDAWLLEPQRQVWDNRTGTLA